MIRPSVTTPPLPEQTVELLRRARGGDAGAVDELFRRYAPRVRGLAAVRMGEALVDVVDCDDIVQEALLAARERLQQFEPRSEGSFICWLAAIVQSRVENARRAARAGKRGGGAVRRGSELGATTLAQMPPARGPSPSQELSARESDPALERALLSLDRTARQIVYCRLVLEMSHAEIAAELGLSGVDSARAQFHKALDRLRQRLGGPRGGPAPA